LRAVPPPDDADRVCIGGHAFIFGCKTADCGAGQEFRKNFANLWQVAATRTNRMLRLTVLGLTTVGSLLVGSGLATGTAHADPAPMVCQDGSTLATPTNSCTYQWCPGSPILKNMPNWDMNVCHPWYFDQNSPLTNSTIIEGFPPPYPPGPPCIPLVTRLICE